MDISAIFDNAQQAVHLLGGSADLLQKLRKLVKLSDNGAVDALQVAELTLDLQNQIIDARNAQSAILNDLLELKQMMIQMDRRRELETRYALHETAAGAQVLALRSDCNSSEPLHYICPACADDAKKSILQPQGTGKCCNACKIFFAFTPSDDTPRRVKRSDWF